VKKKQVKKQGLKNPDRLNIISVSVVVIYQLFAILFAQFVPKIMLKLN